MEQYFVSKRSLVILVILLQSSLMNCADCGHQAPLVSTAIGLNWCISNQIIVFCCFVEGSLVSSCTSRTWDELDVKRSEGVQDCHIPVKWFTGWPRYHGSSVWSIHSVWTLWLRLTNQSAQKSCLIGMFGRQIDPLHLTIVTQLADKSAELIIYARHGWLINWLRTTNL